MAISNDEVVKSLVANDQRRSDEMRASHLNTVRKLLGIKNAFIQQSCCYHSVIKSMYMKHFQSCNFGSVKFVNSSPFCPYVHLTKYGQWNLQWKCELLKPILIVSIAEENRLRLRDGIYFVYSIFVVFLGFIWQSLSHNWITTLLFSTQMSLSTNE